MKRLIVGSLLWLAGVAWAASTVPPQLISPTGSTSGQAILSNGPSSAPTWQAVAATALGPISANTVVGNKTASSSSPTAIAIPSCSTANSALQWISGTGPACGTAFAVTSGNLSQFASTSSSQLLGVLSDETGSGSAVFSVSPTFTGTVNAAALTASGAITPNQTAGIVGTTTNNDANSGSIGEYATATGSGVALTNGVSANCASIPLSAGDWDIEGIVTFTPAGTTTMSGYHISISDVSATVQSNKNASMNLTMTTGLGQIIPTPVVRQALPTTTTIYLVGVLNFGVSTATCSGFIRARRVR